MTWNKFDVEITSSPSIGSTHYAPGDRVAGVVTLNLPKSFDLKTIEVSFEGKAVVSVDVEVHQSTSKESGDRAGSMATSQVKDAVQLFTKKNILFPPQDLGTAISGHSLTLQEGNYSYKFEFIMPGFAHEEAGTLWAGRPLPPSLSVEYTDKSAIVSYSINCRIRVPGFFSRDMRKSVPVLFLPEGPPFLSQDRAFVQRQLTLSVYDQPYESWTQFAARAVGLPTYTDQLKLVSRVTHPSSGIPVSCDNTYPISQFVAAEILLPKEVAESEKKSKTSHPLFVSYIKLGVNSIWTFDPRKGSYHHENSLERRSTVFFEKKALNFQLEFFDGAASLTPLFSEDMIPAGLTPTFQAPSFSIQHELFLHVTVNTSVGNPIVPVTASLSKSLLIYSSKPNHQYTPGSERLDGPPPSYHPSDNV